MAQSARSRRFIPILLVTLGVVLIFGSIFWMVWTERSESTATAEPSAAGQRIPYPDISRVGVGDAKAALEIQNAIFLDPRGEPFYSEGHIPGAISIPEDELEARLGELDPDAWIITYCT